MKKALPNNEAVPVAVYNSWVPECIAIFKDRQVLGKYLMLPNSRPEIINKNVWKAINNKTPLSSASNRLEIKLALRNANKEQLEILKDKDYAILVDYIPQPLFSDLKSFNSTRESMAKDHDRPGLSQHNSIKKHKQSKITQHVPNNNSKDC